VNLSPHAAGRLYFRQLLAGRDVSVGDEFAAQMANYVYVIGDRESHEAVLIDAAYGPAEIVDLVRADGMEPVGAIVTHYHADHAGGVIAGLEIPGLAALLEVVDLPVHVQATEVSWLASQTGIDAASLIVHASGDVIAVGGLPLTLIHTPGHTEGSQCLLIEGCLLTGDTLFLDGCGRTDLPGGDAGALYETLTQRLAVIADTTPVFAGHAYSVEPTASMGELRRHNPVLFPLDRATWLSYFGN
jgi:glyoxylase-like metal-dependent hydrolase (beta-lactamase superfamily II)